MNLARIESNEELAFKYLREAYKAYRQFLEIVDSLEGETPPGVWDDLEEIEAVFERAQT